MYQAQTVTDDTYDNGFLEPWSQWVSVHIGQPSKEHQIKHLGDVPHLSSKQIWETLSDMGYTSGVWGAMNASRGEAENCLFFLPDPWTYSENSYPKELQPLLDFLRYSSKNYLNISFFVLLKQAIQLLRFFSRYKVLKPLLRELPHLFKQLKNFKKESYKFISLFDYVSTLSFLQFKKRYEPDFSLIFLNSLAHLQHHHWHEDDPQALARFEYGLYYLDKSMGQIYHSLGKDDIVLMANALSQKNTKEDIPWVLYRQKDQRAFLKEVGIKFESVESHMTHDAHILFQNQEDAAKAKEILSKATINQTPLFHIESYDEAPNKLFYKIIFTDQIAEDSLMEINGQQFLFFDLFQKITQRTGKHIQAGSLLCNRKLENEKIYNHEIYDYVLDLFKGSKAPLS